MVVALAEDQPSMACRFVCRVCLKEQDCTNSEQESTFRRTHAHNARVHLPADPNDFEDPTD